MTPAEQERVQACIQELAEIFYHNTSSESLSTLEGIEQAVRQHILEQVSPQMRIFLSEKVQAPIEVK